jgi:MFS transporter, DHA2 family, methylenomycin A resistance protein
VFLQSLYFQQQRGASALTTGMLLLPMTGMVAVLNPLVAKLLQKYGRVAIIITGQLLMVAGLATLALAPATAPTLLVALLMVPIGVGGSFTVPPVTAVIIDHVPSQRAGTASGVLNTARQMGGSLGVAVFGAVLAHNANFTTGLRADLTVAAALLLALTAVTLRLRPLNQ